jgi:hypothetical protein
VRALLDMRDQWVAERRGDLPHWLQVVKADVLLPETPVEVRRLVAGEEQYRQQNVSRVKVSEFLRHLCQWTPVEPRVELVHRVADAVAKAGYTRLDTKVCSFFPADAGNPPVSLFATQAALLKEYRHLAVCCVQLGATFVDAVANMERRMGNAFSLSLLRELRSLATPESRERIVSFMASDGVSAKTFRKAVEDTVLEMWVGWHWAAAPDSHIHPTKRVPSLCFALACHPRQCVLGHVSFQCHLRAHTCLAWSLCTPLPAPARIAFALVCDIHSLAQVPVCGRAATSWRPWPRGTWW